MWCCASELRPLERQEALAQALEFCANMEQSPPRFGHAVVDDELSAGAKAQEELDEHLIWAGAEGAVAVQKLQIAWGGKKSKVIRGAAAATAAVEHVQSSAPMSMQPDGMSCLRLC